MREDGTADENEEGMALQQAWSRRLLPAARAVRLNAHAPYSRFAVGAAVLDEQGRVHVGCNVENAAYPQGWCAETSALAAMVAAGGKRVLAVAVCAESSEPVTPCGGCRQKLREFAADDCPVFIGDEHTLRCTHSLGELLPHSFGPQHLVQLPVPQPVAHPAPNERD